MNELRRRHFLGLATGAAGLALAGCMRAGAQTGAWSPADGDDGTPEDLVRRAWERARDAGRPLLVITIPAGDQDKHQLGNAWGELLQHGADEVLATLALCEVVCATHEVARRSLAGLPGLPVEETVAFVVETDVPRAARVDVELPTIDAVWDPDGEEGYEREVRARMQVFGDALTRAIAPDHAALVRRAEACAERLGGAENLALDPFASSNRTAREEARRAPARVRLYAAGEDARTEEALALLAAVTTEQLVARPPAGTRWATSGGCGVDVEGCEGMMVACGMGHVPAISSRFLYFYATEGA